MLLDDVLPSEIIMNENISANITLGVILGILILIVIIFCIWSGKKKKQDKNLKNKN